MLVIEEKNQSYLCRKNIYHNIVDILQMILNLNIKKKKENRP